MSETIVSERLDLVLLTRHFLQDLLDGRRAEAERLGGFTIPGHWPDAHDAGFLELRLRETLANQSIAPWLVRAIVLRGEARPMIGHVGFHGPPGRNARRQARALEVGYTIFPEHRRRGYATEAVVALLGWAGERGIRHFIASVAPTNTASLALVRRLGFRQVGRHWDEEDGEELEFELLGGITAGA